MPFFDRFWWLTVSYGLIHLALGIAFLAWVLSTSAGSPGDPADGAVPLCGGVALLAVFVAIGLEISALRGRRRKLARLAAIAGNPDAVPLARMRMPTGPVADVATQSLVLAWRAKMSARAGALIGGVLLVGTLAVVLVSGVFILKDMISLAQATPVNLLPFAVVALLLADLALMPSSNLLRRPILFGGRIQTIAGEDGVRYKTPLRRQLFVPWSDARLLEVRLGGSSPSLWGGGRHFTLYGTNSVVEWHHKASGDGSLVPVGANAEEQSERALALLHLVHARTGLVPRTFDLGLQALDIRADQRARATAHQQRRRMLDRLENWGVTALLTVILGGSVVGLLALAAAVVLVPLTTSPALNLLVGAAIALPTLTATAAAVVRLLRMRGLLLGQRPRDREPAAPVTPATSPPPSMQPFQVEQGVVYVFTVAFTGMTLRSRLLVAVGFGVLCTILLLPAVIGILMLVHGPLPGGVRLASAGDFQVVVAILLAIPGIAGPLLLVASVLPHRQPPDRVIRAGPDALETTDTRIPWDRVESITAVPRGLDMAYAVTAISDTGPIVWSAQHATFASASLSPRTQAVTAEELANIVAQRGGVPLTVRRMI